jgi:IclR family pca regulon transcriptional regulator
MAGKNHKRESRPRPRVAEPQGWAQGNPSPVKNGELPGQGAQGDPDFMTSLARGLSVLQTFSELKRPATMSQLSGRTGLSRAVVRRCLHTLTQLGYAGCDESRRFFLLPKVMELGYGYLASMPFAQAVQPILERLGETLRESCSVTVLEGDEVVYIARALVTRIMSIDLRIGSRLPAFCTSTGRVLLAHLPPPQLEAYLRRIRPIRHTSRTLTSIEKLTQALRAVRRNGYAIVDQELEAGLRSIAVPIRNHNGEVVASLNAGTHAQRVSTVELHDKFLPPLLDAANQLGMLFMAYPSGSSNASTR